MQSPCSLAASHRLFKFTLSRINIRCLLKRLYLVFLSSLAKVGLEIEMCLFKFHSKPYLGPGVILLSNTYLRYNFKSEGLVLLKPLLSGITGMWEGTLASKPIVICILAPWFGLVWLSGPDSEIQ